MKNIFNYALFVILLSFIFVIKVNAECSYQERKDLLNEAKAVDISVEPVYKDGIYSFKFIVAGMSDNFFIKYTNLNSGEEKYIFDFDLIEGGIYTFEDTDFLSVYNYKFFIYTTNENCTGSEIYTKKIVKPMYNIYSENINCTFENNKDFKYCQKFFYKNYNLNEEEFNSELIKYNMNNNMVEDTELIEQNGTISQYWPYIFVVGIFIVIIVCVIIFVRKKKNVL